MDNKNTCVAFQHTNLKDAYRKLIVQMLIDHGVKSMTCNSSKEHFFDRVEVYPNGTIAVWNHGLSEPFSNFLFDFTCDFARCISYIEDAIYQQQHGVNGEHGITIEFED